MFKFKYCHRQWKRNERIKKSDPLSTKTYKSLYDRQWEHFNELTSLATANGYDVFGGYDFSGDKCRDSVEILKNGILHATIKLYRYADSEIETYVKFFSKEDPFVAA